MDNAAEPFALGVAMAMVVVMAALVGTGVWAAVRLEGHMDTPATLARQSEHRHGPPAVHRTGTGHLGAGHVGTRHVGHGHIGTGRNVRCRDRAAHQPAALGAALVPLLPAGSHAHAERAAQKDHG